jgi:hypothetical protein
MLYKKFTKILLKLDINIREKMPLISGLHLYFRENGKIEVRRLG